jgi:hypothetical protein
MHSRRRSSLRVSIGNPFVSDVQASIESLGSDVTGSVEALAVETTDEIPEFELWGGDKNPDNPITQFQNIVTSIPKRGQTFKNASGDILIILNHACLDNLDKIILQLASLSEKDTVHIYGTCDIPVRRAAALISVLQDTVATTHYYLVHHRRLHMLAVACACNHLHVTWASKVEVFAPEIQISGQEYTDVVNSVDYGHTLAKKLGDIVVTAGLLTSEELDHFMEKAVSFQISHDTLFERVNALTSLTGHVNE